MGDGGAGIGRLLMALGGLVFLAGLLVSLGVRVPLGRLPGDLVIRREDATLYLPIASCLLLSAALSLLLWLVRR